MALQISSTEVCLCLRWAAHASKSYAHLWVEIAEVDGTISKVGWVRDHAEGIGIRADASVGQVEVDAEAAGVVGRHLSSSEIVRLLLMLILRYIGT